MRLSVEALVNIPYEMSTTIQIGNPAYNNLLPLDVDLTSHVYSTTYHGTGSLDRDYAELLAISNLILSVRAIDYSNANGCKVKGNLPYYLELPISSIQDTMSLLSWKHQEQLSTINSIRRNAIGVLKMSTLIDYGNGITKIEFQSNIGNRDMYMHLIGTKKKSLGIDTVITKRWLINHLNTSDIWYKWDSLYKESISPIQHAHSSLVNMRDYILSL